jgi:hypothetical protein
VAIAVEASTFMTTWMATAYRDVQALMFSNKVTHASKVFDLDPSLFVQAFVGVQTSAVFA